MPPSKYGTAQQAQPVDPAHRVEYTAPGDGAVTVVQGSGTDPLGDILARLYPSNPAQLCTLEEARVLAKVLTANGVGGGVRPVAPDQGESGIYVPIWLAGPAGFRPPSGGDEENPTRWYHLRFENGAEGINAGLILDMFRRHPAAPHYVLETVRRNVELQAQERAVLGG